MESNHIENVNVTISGNTITSSEVTGLSISSNHTPALPDENAEILRELQRVRKQLETTEPMIADALASLEEAVKAQDKPTIKKLLGKFAGETTKDVLTGIASSMLLSWMGIA